MEAMKRFVFDPACCRVTTMLDYFGESNTSPCGKCDVCPKPAPLPAPTTTQWQPPSSAPSRPPGPHTPASLAPRIGVSPAVVAEAARLLIDRGRATITPQGTIAPL